MFVVAKRNIILPGPNGEKFRMEKDYMGPVPAWAEGSDYLKALAADGKVIISESGTDKDFSKKDKNSKKPPKPPKTDKPPKEDTSNGDPSEEEKPELEGEGTPDGVAE